MSPQDEVLYKEKVWALARDMESPDSLPLFACTRRLLYDRCAHDRRLTVAAYDLLGDYTRRLSPIQNAVRSCRTVINYATPTLYLSMA
jgi:hypothetical protein